MQIRKQQAGEFTELVISGRLDGYWADHLTGALEEVVRGGADHIRVDLSGITYISSMGVRVLLQFYQQLQSIHGVFAVAHPSAPVKKVLEMMGLRGLLFSTGPSPPRRCRARDCAPIGAPHRALRRL